MATGYSVFVAIAFGLFISPLTQEFGWNRTEISLAFTICTYVIVVLSPLVGIWIDRHGVRTLLLPGIAAFAVALAALALQNGSLWVLYGLYAVAAIAGSATLPPGYSRIVVAWFTTHRGLALSVALSGVGISAIVLPPILESVISHHGWRVAYIGLGAICLGVTLPVVTAWLREPAQSNSGKSAQSLVVPPLQWDTILLRISAATLTLGIAVGGVLVHLVPLLTERFQSTQRAATAFSLLGIATLISRLACGWLLDRIRATRVSLIVFLISGAGVIWLGMEAEPVATYVALLALGVGFGADFDVISYVISRYFPLESFSRVYGTVYSIFLVGIGTGSALTGLGYDFFGSYNAAFVGLGILLCLTGVLFSSLGPYRHALVQN